MIEDIMHGRAMPDQIKITLRRDRLAKKNILAIIELYKNQKALRSNTILECNLSSYTAAQCNLKPLLQKAKAEGKATWKHLKARAIKIGFINLTLRGNTVDTKRMYLDDSWFIFNEPERKIIIYLWNKRFELDLSLQKSATGKGRYYGSGYIDFTTDQPGATANSQPCSIKVPILKDPQTPCDLKKYHELIVEHRNSIQLFEVMEAFKEDRVNNRTDVSVDAFMTFLEMEWVNPIAGDDGLITFSHNKDAIRKYLENNDNI